MQKYEDIKDRLQLKLSSFDSVIDKLNYANMFFLNQENLMMVGKQLDEGKIGETLENVKIARDNFNTVIDECNQKIIETNRLYEEALSRELAAKKEQEEADENA